MRVGLFGGTFDPPHVGHWLAAVDAHETLELDRLVFVPAAQQPLKQHRESAPADDRLAMVRTMVGDDERFSVDALEIERAGLSYTVDTLAAYHQRAPVSELFFVIGADALEAFHLWREPERIQALATLAVLRRDDDTVEVPVGVRARPLRSRRVDVSSTEVRARVRAGQSIRGFVPEAVEAYVSRAGLYR